MSQQYWELIGRIASAIWPSVTGLVGVFIGAYIANRNQRKHWIADNKKREYQELITAITRAFHAMLNRRHPTRQHGPEDERAFEAAEQEVSIVIGDRIFIWEECVRLKILRRWQKLAGDVRAKRDIEGLGDAVGDLRGDLIIEARKLMR